MTMQEREASMNMKDRFVNTVLCHFKVAENGYWDADSKRNKILYKILKAVLGEDPLDRFLRYAYAIIDPCTEKDIQEFREAELEIARLKAAYN